ncbi:hypothetical protein ZHAS_00021161 [Anopheles sinensis]|uniref:Uncharacterized protein n=1 Tax=Anopheles sinensis TaxID=74873 RepID=A0A084WRP1_ANOSI|nr:hypothetical protein ZHAS_00021161 [Anopheles sinensis]
MKELVPPFVFAVRSGSVLEFANSDDTVHLRHVLVDRDGTSRTVPAENGLTEIPANRTVEERNKTDGDGHVLGLGFPRFPRLREDRWRTR